MLNIVQCDRNAFVHRLHHASADSVRNTRPLSAPPAARPSSRHNGPVNERECSFICVSVCVFCILICVVIAHFSSAAAAASKQMTPLKYINSPKMSKPIPAKSIEPWRGHRGKAAHAPSSELDLLVWYEICELEASSE